MRAINLRYWILALAATACLGCRAWTPLEPHDRSLLKPIGLADDGVQLEIISVRFPYGQEQINGPMWDEIDEQQIPLEVRRRLTENGIRVGVVGRQLPAALAQLIATDEKPPTSIGQAAAQLQRSSPVSREQMQLHSGWHGEIMSSTVYPEMPLLMPDDGRLCGHTFLAAQGVLQTSANGQGDHRVRLQITPELQYGEVRQEWFTEDGRMLPQQGKPKRVFDRLAFEVTLAPEQRLLLTCLSDRGGTLGHYLFTESRDDQLQQKLLIVHLAQSRYDDLFTPPESATIQRSGGSSEDSGSQQADQADSSAASKAASAAKSAQRSR